MGSCRGCLVDSGGGGWGVPKISSASKSVYAGGTSPCFSGCVMDVIEERKHSNLLTTSSMHSHWVINSTPHMGLGSIRPRPRLLAALHH